MIIEITINNNFFKNEIDQSGTCTLNKCQKELYVLMFGSLQHSRFTHFGMRNRWTSCVHQQQFTENRQRFCF